MQLPAAQQVQALVGPWAISACQLCLAWLAAACDASAVRACCFSTSYTPSMQILSNAHPPAAGSRLGASTADFDSANFHQRLTISPALSRSASLAVASQDGVSYSQQPVAKLHLAQMSSMQLMNTQLPTDLQGLQVSKVHCLGLLPVSVKPASQQLATPRCPQSGRRRR